MLFKKLRILTLLFATLAAAACNQDPIFSTISKESKPLEPRIKGSPSNMVVFTRGGQDILCVASGSSLRWYRDGGWNNSSYSIPAPGGDILGLAATATDLYASTEEGLKRIGISENYWTTITGSESISVKYVFAANNRVFVGAGTDPGYTIREVLAGALITVSATNPGMLTGAAYDGIGDCFLSTSKGIYKEGTASRLGSDHNFMGIISLGGAQIVALRRDNGELWNVTGSGVTDSGKKMNKYATTALALWSQSSSSGPKLLLAGMQESLSYTTSSAYVNGYREFPLTGSIGSFSISNPQEPGTGSPTSAANNDQYISSIGKHPVNHLFQAPASVDSDMPVFASTVNEGLWSYRERNGILQWNAEE
jgi:hypothetical protein